MRAGQAGSHQFQRPRIAITAGTRTARTIVASSRGPTASKVAAILTSVSGPALRETKASPRISAALGKRRFQAEFEAGRDLNREAAIGLALGEPVHAAAVAAGDTAPSPLSKREAEVAHLVTDGLSNKQIAARLLISEHTVDSHIRHILNKLGFNSRAQIAAWMASSGQ
jgi:DNA-binding CsgD family transcriptional regulator